MKDFHSWMMQKVKELQFLNSFHFLRKSVLILTRSWNAKWTWRISELSYIHYGRTDQPIDESTYRASYKSVAW